MSTARTPDRRRRRSGRLGGTLAALGALLLTAVLIALVADRIFFHDSSTPAGTGSGVAATQARSLPPFTGVELAGANNVIVQVGPKQSVTVHGDSNLLGRVTTRVRSGRLVIATTPGELAAKSPMFVTVSVPSVDELRLSGAGNIVVSGIDSRTLTVALPGSGNIDAAGTATKLDVSIGGQGTARLHQLVARDASAAIRGSGTIMVTATRRLTATVAGNGSILYRGDPAQVTRTVTGNGAITAG